MAQPALYDVERYAVLSSIDCESMTERFRLAEGFCNAGRLHHSLNMLPCGSSTSMATNAAQLHPISGHLSRLRLDQAGRRGTGTARNTPSFRCFNVSNTIASLLTSIRSAVSARTSEIRAPVHASVRQNAPTAPPSITAAATKDNLSRATRYLRVPVWSNRVWVHARSSCSICEENRAPGIDGGKGE